MVSYEMDEKDIIEILSSNFDFNVVESPVGKSIEINPYLGFLYSHVTGSGYFEDTSWQFSCKSLTRIFNSAESYNFVTGIYDGVEIESSPLEMYKRRPYLFNDKKRVLPVSFSNRRELNQKLEKYKEKLGEDSKNYIIQEVDLSKEGNGLEHFLEFLFTMKMREKGYNVENQVPLGHSQGTPDAACFGMPNIDLGGVFFLELSMLRVGHEPDFIEKKTEFNTIVGEAKTSTDLMSNQIEKYLDTGYFDIGYEVHPRKKIQDKSKFGLFTLDNQEISIKQPKVSEVFSRKERKEEYLKWIKDYMKFYLLANLTTEELEDFYLGSTDTELDSQEELVDFVKSRSLINLYHGISASYGTIER
jgi:hypothetical protein